MEELMDRAKLVGWIVRDGINASGLPYTEAARRWPMSLPTLNRLMSGVVVSARFYRIAERNLDLPRGLLDHVLNDDAEAVKAMDIDEPLRTYILTEMGASPTPKRRKRA
jgi:hypothetical protein